jgi:hypothetical protein
MKFKSRLERLEARRTTTPWVAPIIFHSIIEPRENGPREVGAFAKLFSDGKNIIIWRSEDETHEDFETKVMTIKANCVLPDVAMRSHE